MNIFLLWSIPNYLTKKIEEEYTIFDKNDPTSLLPVSKSNDVNSKMLLLLIRLTENFTFIQLDPLFDRIMQSMNYATCSS